MFGFSEDLPDGYVRAQLPSTPFGASAVACTRCGALIAPAMLHKQAPGSSARLHDQWHASLEVRVNGG